MRRTAPLLLAVLAAGCGSPPPTRVAGDSVSIRITDFRYDPQSLRLRRGVLTFRVRNDGRLPHNFAITGKRGRALSISTMLPGESGEGIVVLPRGVYRMFCTIGNHEELGEYGAIVVR